ncbi:hypothetical protein AB0L04_34100 [Streptomyces glaucescens]|uniref:hypothetical protein n=1 Tax=Streptomyces glaucescens TaxID=1907 RepID=UPI00344E2EC5
MRQPFEHTILSVAPIPPGFQVKVTHHETYRGEPERTVETAYYPVIGWAVVKCDDWSSGREATSVEPVFLHSGRPVVTSEYRYMFSDLAPAPDEPKQTVGVKVIPPEEIR